MQSLEQTKLQMGTFKFSKKAVDDLTAIWAYTDNEWSKFQAERYYRMLIESCNDISDNPEIGKDYSLAAKELYGIISGRHIIFYRKLSAKEIVIIRILHEQMDLKSRIRE